jgi:hypothetical protein
MSDFAEKLAVRRRELLVRCAEQRRNLAIHGHEISGPMSKVDTALAFIGRIKQHPGVIAAIVVGLVAIRPGRLARLASLGALGLRGLHILRTFAPVIQGLRARY